MTDERPVGFRNTQRLEISVPHGHLEARFEVPEDDGAGAALLCHPHPQYGGNMNTKALYHLTRTLNELGFSTLRFNFRGVGASTGSYDGGEGERDDARTALSTLKDRVSLDEGSLLCGGFSFGSAVGLRVGTEDDEVDGLIGIGLPVDLADFGYLGGDARPFLAVQGEHDQFGSPDRVRDVLNLDRGNVALHVIEGSEHLFTGYFEELREAVRAFFSSGPGGLLIADRSKRGGTSTGQA